MSGNRRAAATALDHARPAVDRLDPARDPEDLAADIIEAWGATQTALRALIGSTPLSGQALIRELRQREQLTLDQAHALVEFSSAHDRAQRTDYRPTSADIAAARAGFQQLEAAVLHAPTAAPGRATAPAAAMAGAAAAGASTLDPAFTAPPTDGGVVQRRPRRRGFPLIALLGILLVLALLIGGGIWWYGGRADRAVARGVEAYQSGDRTAARNAFAEAIRIDDGMALPHIYLGRIAREENDVTTAARELETAVRLEPNNALAQREMGAHLLAAGRLDLARNFYTRAVELDPTDRNAQGFLGCTLIRLGRPDVGMNFLNRAGQGSWSACANLVPRAPMPGTLPPGVAPSTSLPPR